MKLTVHAFTTFDGVMQGPGAPDEDRSNDFAYGGWMVPFADEEMGAIVDGWFPATAELLLGRRTYEMMYAYWSQITEPDNLVATKLNGLPKHVVSRSLRQAEWQHTSIVDGDVDAAVRALKDRDAGELQVHGSWQLVQTLHRLGVVDEYRVLAFPVVLGDGKRLFADAPPTSLDVVEARATPSGAAYTVLRPAGTFTVGEFSVAEGTEVTTLA